MCLQEGEGADRVDDDGLVLSPVEIRKREGGWCCACNRWACERTVGVPAVVERGCRREPTYREEGKETEGRRRRKRKARTEREGDWTAGVAGGWLLWKTVVAGGSYRDYGKKEEDQRKKKRRRERNQRQRKRRRRESREE